MKPVILEICHDLESSNRIYDSYKKGHQRELEDGMSRDGEENAFSIIGHSSKYEREYGSTDEIFLKIKNVLTRPGGLVAIPTETVYGLAGNIYIEKSLKRIFEIKNRPFNDPLIVHVDSFTSALEELYDVNMFEAFIMLYLANRFTPGPLTMVARCNSNVSRLLTNNTGYLATRCPDNELCRALLRYLNIPLAAPSANKFGHISPTCAEHVYDEFSNEELHILDGGQCKIGIESTVIKITTIDEPEIVCRDKLYSFSSNRQHLVKNVYIDCRDAIVDMFGELNKIIVNNRGRMTSRDVFGRKQKMKSLSATNLHRYGGAKNGFSIERRYSSDSRYGIGDRFHNDDSYRKERMYDQERRTLQELIFGTEDRYRQKLTYNRESHLNRHCGVSQEGGSTSYYNRSAMTGNCGLSNSSVRVDFTQRGGSTCIYYGGYAVDSMLNPSNNGSTEASRCNSVTDSGYSSDSGSKKGNKSRHEKGFESSDFKSYKGVKLHGSSRRVEVEYENGKIDLFELLEKYQNVMFKVEILRKGAVTYEHLRYELSGFNNVKVCEYELKPEKESENDTTIEDKAVVEDVLEEKQNILENLQKYRLWQRKVEDLRNGNVTFAGLRNIISALRKLKALRAMTGANTAGGDLGSDHDNNDDDYLSVNDFDDRISVDHFGSNDDDYMSIDDVDNSFTDVIDNISADFQKDNKGALIPNGIADSISNSIDSIANGRYNNDTADGAALGGDNGTIIAGSTADTVANGIVNGKDSYQGTDGDRTQVPGATSADNRVRSNARSSSYIGNCISRRYDHDTGKDKDMIIADISGKNDLCSVCLGKGSVDDHDNENSDKDGRVSGEHDIRFEAPGMSLTHYAPNVPTYLVVITKDDRTLNGRNGGEDRGNRDWTEHIGGRVSNDTNNGTGLKKVDCGNIVMIDIGYRFKSHSNMFKEYLPVINEPTSVANQLYSVLRKAESAAHPSVDDHSDTNAIIAIYFNERKIQLYSAIHDRITRSTSGNPIYAQINDEELEFLVK
ncbi:hypothetical protein MACJ_002084 [Theileria orientalis]|uniref:Threonylcarbamoyl-AMP synthase n=1 Tax=Theileria orientalis TaxID=68886 RepID=A0A976M5L8_THEOR|nr:hypothetical protein MACJ_002084 [Theileria orientalis]